MNDSYEIHVASSSLSRKDLMPRNVRQRRARPRDVDVERVEIIAWFLGIRRKRIVGQTRSRREAVQRSYTMNIRKRQSWANKGSQNEDRQTDWLDVLGLHFRALCWSEAAAGTLKFTGE